jgi:undecaprenyl phosphate N,N'-diacetylbacillosamine 1-phosphate transferase
MGVNAPDVQRALRQPKIVGATKRILDLFITVACLPVALPLIGVVGLAIKIETPGGIFFRQERIGRSYRPFTIHKLRTMVENAEQIGAGLYAEPNDARITKVGAFARRFSLDELPQLFDVLRGEMSIVGPRPMPAAVVTQYREAYDEILLVPPGLTGLAQVSGRNELTRSERLQLDRSYIRNWTIWLDLKILVRTLSVVFTGAGQRTDQSAQDVER